MTITELQQQTEELAARFPDRSVDRRLAFVMMEVGEVAQACVAFERAQDDAGHEQAATELGMEIYDVFWNLCDLANLIGINLEDAFARKRELNRHRAW